MRAQAAATIPGPQPGKPPVSRAESRPRPAACARQGTIPRPAACGVLRLAAAASAAAWPELRRRRFRPAGLQPPLAGASSPGAALARAPCPGAAAAPARARGRQYAHRSGCDDGDDSHARVTAARIRRVGAGQGGARHQARRACRPRADRAPRAQALASPPAAFGAIDGTRLPAARRCGNTTRSRRATSAHAGRGSRSPRRAAAGTGGDRRTCSCGLASREARVGSPGAIRCERIGIRPRDRSALA